MKTKRFPPRISIRTRMFVRISLLLLLVISVMIFVLRSAIKARLEAEQIQLQLLKTASMQDVLDNYMMTLMTKTDVLFVDENFTGLIETHPPNMAENVQKSSALKNLMDLTLFNLRYPEISIANYSGGQVTACLYIRDLGLYQDDKFIRDFTEIQNESYIDKLMTEKRTFSWNYVLSDRQSGYIAFNRRILSLHNLRDIAILQLRIPIPKIMTILNSTSSEYLLASYYLDEEGNVICTNGDAAYLPEVRDIPGGTGEVIRFRSSGERCVVNCTQSGLNGYRLVCVSSMKPIHDSVQFITPIFVSAGLAAVALGCACLYFLSGSLLKGVHQLVEKAQVASLATDRYEHLSPIRDTVEIEGLDSAYARLVSTINHLHSMETRNQEILNEVQIELLQEQFNPHLLYNTLSMIRYLEESSGQQKICAVLDHLIAFYRQVLNRGQLITSVREELRMTANYMSIVHEVYAIDLISRIDVADDVMDFCTVKMFLQPIVENAVLHGVREMGAGTVAITGVREDGKLHFTITDNGIGMEPETLERIRRQINSPDAESGSGYGYVSVTKRLRLFFGDSYHMDLHSELDEGTRVDLYIPALREDQISDSLRSRMI